MELPKIVLSLHPKQYYMKRTYEILGYMTKDDFTKKRFTVIENGLTNKRKAVALAKEIYNNEPYRIMKVQSKDREFIQILNHLQDYSETDY